MQTSLIDSILLLVATFAFVSIVITTTAIIKILGKQVLIEENVMCSYESVDYNGDIYDYDLNNNKKTE